MKKRILSLLPALGCVLALSVPAFAAQGQTVHADMRCPHILVENIYAGFLDDQGGRRDPLLYHGSVYIPLRTAGLWMGARADWDREARTVTFTSTGETPIYYSGFDFNTMDIERLEGIEQYQADMADGVDVELCSDVTVIVDGQACQFTNALGQRVYPMLFRECVYLPVRSVGELCGKQVLWRPFQSRYGSTGHGDIFLFDFPTAGQLDEAGAYFAAVREHTEAVRTLALTWSQEETVTDEQFIEKTTAMRTSVQAILDLPVPSFSGVGVYVDQIRFYADLVTQYTLPDPAYRVLRPDYRPSPAQRLEDIRFSLFGSGDAGTYFLHLENSCADGASLLTLAAAE